MHIRGHNGPALSKHNIRTVCDHALRVSARTIAYLVHFVVVVLQTGSYWSMVNIAGRRPTHCWQMCGDETSLWMKSLSPIFLSLMKAMGQRREHARTHTHTPTSIQGLVTARTAYSVCCGTHCHYSSKVNRTNTPMGTF